MTEYDDKSKVIIGCAMRVHAYLGPGFLESVYKNAMVIEMKKLNLNFEVEKEINVYYDNQEVGIFRADIMVDDFIIELKSYTSLLPIHYAQIVNYLKVTNLPFGLLINFGESSLKFKRIINNNYKK